MNLNGKKVLVVGAASGIGAAVAREAAERGAELMLADLSEEGLRATKQAIADAGGVAHTIQVDLADGAMVAAMGKATLEAIGAPDLVLVTVVEYPSTFSGLDDMGVDDWKRAFEINFFGYIRVVEQLLPAMRKRGTGVLALTASTVALLPDPTAAILMRYKAIKHALVGLSQSLAVALEGSGVRSVCFCPAMTATPGAIDNLRQSGLPGIEDVIASAASAEDVARIFLAGLAEEDFLICAHPGHRELMMEWAQEGLDPNTYIARHFPAVG
jgi:NAD(P)-dependent dehydrogenase (short-subunit alcohol dehydrogenase family)